MKLASFCVSEPPRHKLGRVALFCVLQVLASFCIFSLAGCTHRYKAEGIVIATNPDAREVTISHREILGRGKKAYMPAMAMPFTLKQNAHKPMEKLEILSPGSRVGFVLHVSRTTSWIDQLRVQAPAEPGFAVPKSTTRVAIGDPVPDFALPDHLGGTTRLSNLMGRVVVINFIYTRCPLPNVCPRLAAHFGYVARQCKGQPLTLLSITLDPLYDTPEILKNYAAKFDTPQADWRFLSGTEAAIHEAGNLFGLVFFPDEGAITHTSATAIIGRDGRLKAILEGSAYTAPQLRDVVAEALR